MQGEHIAQHETALTARQPKLSSIGLAIFITGILYYCFAYLLRVYPSVMMHGLLTRFHITAGGFGILTSFYYFAYAPMQLPVGISVDKIGPRRSLILAAFVSALGAFMFASSTHLWLALTGRFLIGFGSAFAYVTALKLATLWLPERFFATATGAVTSSGMIAAIFTDLYLTHLVQTSGYMKALHFPIIIGIVLLGLIFIIIRDKPANQKADPNQHEASALSFHQLGNYLSLIIKNRQMWIIGAVGCFLYMPASVFLDVWGISYLKVVYHFTASQAALGATVMLAGWILSSFMTGAISDVLGTRKAPLLIATFGSAAICSSILFVPNIPKDGVLILLFMFGTFCGPHPLCFTLSKENYVSKISGTAISFANFLIMMGGFIFQPAVGKLLDFGWSGALSHGVRIYSSADYTASLSILPVCLLLAGILALFIKETFNNNVAT